MHDSALRATAPATQWTTHVATCTVRWYLVVEGEVDAAVSDGDTARLGVDDGVVDVGEHAVGRHHVDVPVTVLVPRRTHRVGQIRVSFVVQQLQQHIQHVTCTLVVLCRYNTYRRSPCNKY